jgi:hypothetical protein
MTSRTALLTLLTLPALTALALAAPAELDGWTSQAGAGHTRYVAPEHSDVELRVYDPVRSNASLGAWFAERQRRAPDGVRVRGPAQVTTRDTFYASIEAGSRGGARVVIVGLACQRGDSFVYAELIAPPTPEILQRYVEPVTVAVLGSCLEAEAAATAATAGRDARTPARQEPEKPAGPEKPEFRYIAADHKGVARSAIAGVLYSWHQHWVGMSLQIQEDAYLLLQDGTARLGLPPVPPEDLDAAAERSADPTRWGRWKKSGGKYLIQRAGETKFSEPVHAVLRAPGKTDEKLGATYGHWSSQSYGTVGGWWSHASITFTRDGRFSRSHTGGASRNGFGADAIHAASAYNDEGSSTSIVGPQVGGGTTRRSGSTAADRQGSYRIDGYTLELHYDNGRVERRFFYADDERRSIWFDSGEMFLPRKQ